MRRNSHTITAKRVKLLIREGEGLTVEFKERYTARIDQDIVAFSNARGGTLLLGVRDDGSVAGERLTNDLGLGTPFIYLDLWSLYNILCSSFPCSRVGTHMRRSSCRLRQSRLGLTGLDVCIPTEDRENGGEVGGPWE